MKFSAAFLFLFALMLLLPSRTEACSVLYYIDKDTGKIYAVNNEDYWYDVKAYIQILPTSKKKHARLWYGWDNFAQGGINEHGLFFDAAVTPDQEKIKGYTNPRNNLGDIILAKATTVAEAIAVLEDEKIALTNSHIMFGDKNGDAVIIEWVDGEKIIHPMEGNKLIMTNYLISDPNAGNFPCYRFDSIAKRIEEMEKQGGEISLNRVGNLVGQAVQVPGATPEGRIMGTVYTSFINITDGKFVLSYKLSNENVVILDLNEEFAKNEKKKIDLTKW